MCSIPDSRAHVMDYLRQWFGARNQWRIQGGAAPPPPYWLDASWNKWKFCIVLYKILKTFLGRGHSPSPDPTLLFQISGSTTARNGTDCFKGQLWCISSFNLATKHKCVDTLIDVFWWFSLIKWVTPDAAAAMKVYQDKVLQQFLELRALLPLWRLSPGRFCPLKLCIMMKRRM